MGIRCTLIARSSRGEERRLRLDKAWDALEVLLTGGRGVAGGIGDAVTGKGGTACPPLGAYGPSKRLSASRVEVIARSLASIDEETLRARVPLLSELDVHGSFGGATEVDPAIAQLLREEGFDDETDAEEIAWLLELVERLAGFYREAHEEGEEVIVSIG